MMDIWRWICELPNSVDWSVSETPYTFELASSGKSGDGSSRSMQFRAERTAGSNSEALVTFSLCIQGFNPFNTPKILWVSDTCPFNSDKPFLPLILQLLQEIITNSPMAQISTCPRSQLQKLKPDPVEWIMDSHSPESFSSFFDLVFLTRLFWLCVCDAPSEVGSLYLDSLLGPNLEAFSFKQAPVLRTFLVTIGVDAELCFTRTLGYMLSKWLILRDVGAVGLQALATVPGRHAGFSYSMEACGFWTLKGYAPILAMKLVSSRDNKNSVVEAKESVLKYALAHQQLEATIQLEYSVVFHDGYIEVNARVDNLRFHVAKLGFNKNDDVEYAEERHFVSRARVWVGPEVGATYVAGLSLGRSTENGDRKLEVQRLVKGSFGKSKAPMVKTRAKMATRTKMRNWRWDQDVEGNAAIFDAVLYDNMGHEIVACKPRSNINDGGSAHVIDVSCAFDGPNRPYTKTRGLVFAGDDYGEGIGWRLSKEMEGSVLKWRIGGQVWVSYWPKEVKSSHYETRCVEWCDEVDLPLISSK
ncbi:hypothetical protein K2173_002225 [Erythroxylum novogranatense]|uniref:Uncharacterized protein n=1 Tax=Erythroxylum novogranatense TaxID=1862640 RepID=A0AAV8T944_9ROSI|nr:hypothetical protein K2173_002225 [Erythroxylum novogranatense]